MNRQIRFKQTELGMIPEDWEIKTVKELAKINENTINRNYREDDIEYIDTSSVENGRLLETQKLPLKEAPSRAKRILKDDDILVSTVRPNLKHFFFVKKSKKNLVGSTGFAVISAKSINPQFLYYYLTTDKYTEFLTSIADSHTSTYPSFNPDIILNSFCLCPPIYEQNLISKILSDLDSRIELNRQMSQTLEAVGQAIFKRWFVDFEFPNEEGKPYRSSGGEMVESELGEIPKGWSVKELGSFIEFVKGKKPDDVSEIAVEGYLPQILIEILDGGEPLYTNPKGMVTVKETEPIMVMDGASSGRVEIGHKGVLGSTLAKIIPKSELITCSYILHILKIQQEDINQNTTGTSIPHADKEKIKRYEITLPNKQLLEQFEELSLMILHKIMGSKREVKTLANARDSLLPRLMSGRMRVV